MELTPSARQPCVSANVVAEPFREVLLDGSDLGFLALARVSLGSCQWRGMNPGALALANSFGWGGAGGSEGGMDSRATFSTVG
jgi:hypothetical protein